MNNILNKDKQENMKNNKQKIKNIERINIKNQINKQ